MITLLTDFGLTDHYVAVMKGVILSINPMVQLVDLTHQITPFSIAEGAFTLAQCWQYFPEGTIHVAVVDPGVGSARRPVLAEKDGHYFIGPDNGIFSLVKPNSFRHLTASQYFRHPVSNSFHGRDIFSPVAAHLSAGVPVSDFGDLMDGAIALPQSIPVEVSAGVWEGAILHVDRFGNLITNFHWGKFGWVELHPFELKVGNRVVTEWRATYLVPGPIQDNLFAMRGSSDFIEVSQNGSSAALLGNMSGLSLSLTRR